MTKCDRTGGWWQSPHQRQLKQCNQSWRNVKQIDQGPTFPSPPACSEQAETSLTTKPPLPCFNSARDLEYEYFPRVGCKRGLQKAADQGGQCLLEEKIWLCCYHQPSTGCPSFCAKGCTGTEMRKGILSKELSIRHSKKIYIETEGHKGCFLFCGHDFTAIQLELKVNTYWNRDSKGRMNSQYEVDEHQLRGKETLPMLTQHDLITHSSTGVVDSKEVNL